MSRSVLELGLADSRIGGGGDDCRAAAEGRRADDDIAHAAAQHSTAGTALRDGTRYFVDSRKAWAGSQPDSSASSYFPRHHTAPAVLGARQGATGRPA